MDKRGRFSGVVSTFDVAVVARIAELTIMYVCIYLSIYQPMYLPTYLFVCFAILCNQIFFWIESFN